ncbi:hypothetical protein CDD80_6756 [Ophiocordyceps camponoti-rufipedis]|uniref:Uncharacterized protein n=1 Tax=Ophiocordyceps camponoti-rufipedis TaxID=2004952 RepID=A0A2C5YK81_9HYPO|nr:hypothetical protein CDD80_6756 [Ophiocordyceps camponoti-rufipedis]
MFRWLVNVGLLALPIAATLGILIGLQAHRQALGQQPLFSPPIITKWVEQTYCQRYHGVRPDTKGQQYTRLSSVPCSHNQPLTLAVNPNQWGIETGDPGFLCMNVTTYDNQTYATKTTAPQFKVFWQYPSFTDQRSVHAFPNIKLDDDVLPVKLQRVQEIDVDFQWTMRLDNDTGPTSSLDDFKKANVNSNVAIDMFVDKDKEKAKDAEKADFEVMVWFAAIGPATFAIGQKEGPIMSKNVDGTNFNLFYGQNDRKQHVLTWKSTSNADEFHGDLAPLINEVLDTNRPGFPSSSDYLGYFSFGSEAYFSNKPVTFSVPSLSIDIRRTKS